MSILPLILRKLQISCCHSVFFPCSEVRHYRQTQILQTIFGNKQQKMIPFGVLCHSSFCLKGHLSLIVILFPNDHWLWRHRAKNVTKHTNITEIFWMNISLDHSLPNIHHFSLSLTQTHFSSLLWVVVLRAITYISFSPRWSNTPHMWSLSSKYVALLQCSGANQASSIDRLLSWTKVGHFVLTL